MDIWEKHLTFFNRRPESKEDRRARTRDREKKVPDVMTAHVTSRDTTPRDRRHGFGKTPASGNCPRRRSVRRISHKKKKGSLRTSKQFDDSVSEAELSATRHSLEGAQSHEMATSGRGSGQDRFPPPRGALRPRARRAEHTRERPRVASRLTSPRSPSSSRATRVPARGPDADPSAPRTRSARRVDPSLSARDVGVVGRGRDGGVGRGSIRRSASRGRAGAFRVALARRRRPARVRLARRREAGRLHLGRSTRGPSSVRRGEGRAVPRGGGQRLPRRAQGQGQAPS